MTSHLGLSLVNEHITYCYRSLFFFLPPPAVTGGAAASLVFPSAGSPRGKPAQLATLPGAGPLVAAPAAVLRAIAVRHALAPGLRPGARQSTGCTCSATRVASAFHGQALGRVSPLQQAWQPLALEAGPLPVAALQPALAPALAPLGSTCGSPGPSQCRHWHRP